MKTVNIKKRDCNLPTAKNWLRKKYDVVPVTCENKDKSSSENFVLIWQLLIASVEKN